MARAIATATAAAATFLESLGPAVERFILFRILWEFVADRKFQGAKRLFGKHTGSV
jgi:hypothetical protein